MKEALLHIKELATIDADSLRKDYEKQNAHHVNANASSYAGLAGTFEGLLNGIRNYVDSMLKVYYPDAQELADDFALELECELHSKVLLLESNGQPIDWYSDGKITAQRTGDNGDNDVGFELTTKEDGCIADITFQDGIVFYKGKPVDAYELVDLLMSGEDKYDE